MSTPSFQSLSILGPNGPIARRLEGYEVRREQMALAASIEHALTAGEHLLAEAGTGVGKSFAYLVPAILKATSEEKGAKPVVISTGTIALQSQLIDKDIPFLRSVWDREFTAVLAKGRGNYISLRRLNSALERAKQQSPLIQTTDGRTIIDDAEGADLARLANWVETTSDGSRADLDFAPGSAAWDQVVSDSNNCLGKKCPTFEKCFYQRARRRIYNAQVLIVNHSLLFADMALRRAGVSYLPDYQYLILDEAHDIEKIASSHLGINLTIGQIEYFLNGLTGRGARALANRYPAIAVDLQMLDMHCREALVVLAQDLDLLMLRQTRDSKLRLHEPPSVSGNKLGDGLVDALNHLHLRLSTMATACEKEEESMDFSSASKRALSLSTDLEYFSTLGLEGHVYWIERSENRRGRTNFEMRSAPIHVGDVLREQMFNQLESVVMTSATLATDGLGTSTSGGAFGYIRGRLGMQPHNPEDVLLNVAYTAAADALTQPPESTEPPASDPPEPPSEPQSEMDPGAPWAELAAELSSVTAAVPAPLGHFNDLGEGSGVREILLGSPFDFARQATLYIPDIPPPDSSDYDTAAANEIIRAIRRSEGGTFVLFTSYQQMRRACSQIRPELEMRGYTVMMQGESIGREQMLAEFRRGERMVLMGTETFWQGVDVPGRALSAVVITKLPFAVPTEPLFQARAEALDRVKRGSSFMELSLPQAVIKLKQGFGRLIRRSTDTGTITILDSRLLRKPYGRRVLAALPPASRGS